MSNILYENIIKMFMITFKFPDYNRKSTGTDYLLLNLKMHWRGAMHDGRRQCFGANYTNAPWVELH